MIEEEKIQSFRTEFEKIEAEIAQVIIGQKRLIRNVLTAMVAGGNVLLEGMPGLGKTQLVKAISQVMSLSFSRIQFTPDLMPADVTGTSIFAKQEGTFVFQKGPIFANLVLADEINRATPKTQSALLEAMQERTVTAGRETYQLPAPFFVLATQNPLETEGTYPLPEAQMDRFLFKLDVEYPTQEELLGILFLTTRQDQPEPKKICDHEQLLALREIARAVPIAKPVADYLTALVLKTHPTHADAPNEVRQYVRYGASPRGAQAMLLAARIYALLAGRYHVSYSDVKEAARYALRHRIFLNFEGISEGMTPDALIEYLLREDEHEAAL